MKFSALAFSTLLLASQTLLGFVELDRGELLLETRFQAVHDSNIRGNNIKESDTIFSVDPTLRYERSSGRGSLGASAGFNIMRFNDFSEFDSENFHAEFNLGFPVARGSPLAGGVNFGYIEDTRVDQFVNDLVSSERTSFGLNGQYRVRQKISVRGDLSFSDNKTATGNFSDSQDKSARAGIIIHDVWQSVGVTVDYRIRRLKTSGGTVERNDKDKSIFIGLTGQLLPEHIFHKLEAYASFSMQKIDSSSTGGQNNRSAVGYDAQLSWEARPTTNINLSFSKDHQVTINDEIVENSNWSLGVQQQFSQLMTGSLNAVWRKLNYIGGLNRNDDRFGVTASLAYVLGRNWSAGLNVSYDDSNSNEDRFNYDRLQTGIYSTFRF
ncbi:MAG: outer membrane beta-barrel protein [Verrucomicrobia bacterium]|nr:outer membrane beta-barrel protein [Verrucomicrobiota bacterium]